MKLQDAYKIVIMNLKTAGETAWDQREKHATQKDLKPGDLVYLYTLFRKQEQPSNLASCMLVTESYLNLCP